MSFTVCKLEQCCSVNAGTWLKVCLNGFVPQCAFTVAFTLVYCFSCPFANAQFAPRTESKVFRAPTTSTSTNESSSFQDAIVRHCQPDAALRCVIMITPQRLCALGDSGAILISEDQGETWKPANCPTSVNLRAVSFIDENIGIAVGGSVGSYSGISRGALLQTSDGGRTWRMIANDLPNLHGIAVFNSQLIAWGDFDPKRQTGVYRSADLGATWQGLDTGLGAVAHATIVNEQFFLATNDRNQAVVLDLIQNKKRTIQLPVSSGPLQLHFTGRQWLCFGSGGQLYSSSDVEHWTPVSLPISASARALCQWSVLHQQGDTIWVGGFPGSTIARSGDRGLTWQLIKTESGIPHHSFAFQDALRGWACGPFGRILQTQDGGLTWKRGRGASQAGLLAFQHQLAWPALVASVWEHRLPTVALLDQQSGAAAPSSASIQQDYANQIGIHTRLPQAEQTLPHWLVQIAAWQPAILLCDSQQQASQLATLQATVSQSLNIHDHEKQSSELLRELGLDYTLAREAVQKVVWCDAKADGNYNIESSFLLKDFGLAVWDVLSGLSPLHSNSSKASSMQTLWSRSHNRSARDQLMGAMALEPNRFLTSPRGQLGNYQLIMGRVHRQSSFAQLAHQTTSMDQWRNDLAFLTRSLPKHEVAPQLWTLYRQLRDQSAFERQMAVLTTLIDGQPRSDAASWAMLRWLRSQGSQELAILKRTASKFVDDKVVAAVGSGPQNDAVVSKLGESPWNASPFGKTTDSDATSIPGENAGARVVPASTTTSTTGQQHDLNLWFSKLGQFAQFEPRLLQRADVQLLSFARSRFLHSGASADLSRLEQLLARKDRSLWRELALQETRIHKGLWEQLDQICKIRPTAGRPYLDGELTDALWQNAAFTELAGTTTPDSPATTIRWAYDTDYLYLAVSASSSAVQQAAPLVTTRSHDADLSSMQRVEIKLDTDRDYQSVIHLAIGENGETFDRCSGFRSYNPKWHVAVSRAEDSWTAEIAIPRDSLTESDWTGSAWGLTAEYHRGNQKLQSWGDARADIANRDSDASRGILFFATESKAVPARRISK